MHPEAHLFIETAINSIPQRKRVVEFGGRFVNGRVRNLFGITESYIGVDIRPGDDVDVVCDAAVYEPEIPPDAIVCCETFEHAPNWREILRNTYGILAPGGVLLLTAAAPNRAPHSGIHGSTLEGNEYYGNIVPAELTARLYDLGFREWFLEYHQDRGDVYVQAVK